MHFNDFSESIGGQQSTGSEHLKEFSQIKFPLTSLCPELLHNHLTSLLKEEEILASLTVVVKPHLIKKEYPVLLKIFSGGVW